MTEFPGADAAAPGAAAPTSKRKSKPRSSEVRIEHEPAFILHTYPWRETSLIVEAFTRGHGRAALVARGAKRATSQVRGLLNPFCSLALSWLGRGEVKTLTRAEWYGALSPLRGDALLGGFYLNELLVRLLKRGDPHEQLFADYMRTLEHLARGSVSVDAALRGFELDLLRATGYAPSLEHDEHGEAIEPDVWYRVHAQGVTPAPQSDAYLCVRGTVLEALARREFTRTALLPDCKRVLRHLIGYHLDGKPLNTRRVFHDLKQL